MKSWVRRGGMAAALMAWVMFLSACNPCARLSRRCPLVTVAVRDSVHVHDTVIREVVRFDTVQVVRLVREVVSAVVPATDTAKAETAYARAMAWLDALGRIALSMQNKDSAMVLVRQVHELEKRLSERVEYKEVGRVQRVPYVPLVVKILAWVGGIAIIYVGVKTIIRIAVRYTK